MDMQMPELDGYEATSRLRALGYRGTIIALTAHSMAEDRQRCLNAGCTDYLSKPVERSHLLQVVNQYLRAAQPAGATPPGTNAPNSASPTSPERETAPTAEKIRVRIDPEVAPLVPGFLKGIRERCTMLTDAAARDDFGAIQAAGHQIKGAGGSYGFDGLSGIGESLEAAAEAARKDETIRLIHDLELYLERIEVIYE
jgi:HPt (histidine-containing phosphotransfer) domain-containing protein